MNVIKLADFQNRTFIRCLEELLAQAMAGEATGAVAIVGYRQGEPKAYVMGDYQKNSAEALSATFRLEKKLAGRPALQGAKSSALKASTPLGRVMRQKSGSE